MSKKKIVMFDIDGILTEFIGGFTQRASTLFPGVPVTLTCEYPSWNVFPGMTKAMIDATWESIETDPSFWYDLLPLVDGAEAVRIIELADSGGDVYFVTNRYGVGAKYQTEQWLKRRLGVLHPTVILTKRKGEVAKALGATHCIDDKASNASAVAWFTDDKTKSYLLDYPQNRVNSDFLASSVIRISSVAEYLNIIEGVPTHV